MDKAKKTLGLKPNKNENRVQKPQATPVTHPRENGTGKKGKKTAGAKLAEKVKQEIEDEDEAKQEEGTAWYLKDEPSKRELDDTVFLYHGMT